MPQSEPLIANTALFPRNKLCSHSRFVFTGSGVAEFGAGLGAGHTFERSPGNWMQRRMDKSGIMVVGWDVGAGEGER